MAKGLYKTERPQLGECVRMDTPAVEPQAYLTRDTYRANGYQPPFEELPTQEEYEARNA